MKEKILSLIGVKGEVSPKELESLTGLGPAMLFRHLKKLQEEKKILKIGSSPKVFYKLNQDVFLESKIKIDSEIIQENFSLITATGQELLGSVGFVKWCEERKLDINLMVEKYEEQIREYKKFFHNGYIDATQKIQTSFKDNIFLDKLFYLDFYSYPVFGRTKISNWLFYGKTLQQKELMNKVIEISRNKIYTFVLEQKVDCVLFVPPTVPRKTQFMKVLEESLNLSLPKVKIIKTKTPIIIQQKSLKDLGDRIKNAKTSLVVETRDTHFKKLLIIDDFTGSGATLNVIAEKCKKQKVADQVYGLTITGSINGFEVIKEV